MKTTTMLVILVAGGLAMQAAADNTDKGPSAYTKTQKSNWQPFYKALKEKSPSSDKIERVGNISSRPWSQIAGRPAPPAFYDQRVYEPHFTLFSWGSSPPK